MFESIKKIPATAKKVISTGGEVALSIREMGLRKDVTASLLLQTLATACILAIPFLLTRSFEQLMSEDSNTQGTDANKINVNAESIYNLVYFAAALLGSIVFSSSSRLVSASTKQLVGVEVNSRMLKKFSELDLDYTLTKPVGSFVQQVRQVFETQEAVSLWLDELYPTILQFILSDAALFYLNLELGFTLLGTQVFSFALAGVTTQSVDTLYDKQRTDGLRLFGGMIGRIQNHENIRQFGQVQRELTDGKTELMNLSKGASSLSRLPEWNALYQGIWGVLASGGIVSLAIYELQKGQLALNYFGTLVVYSIQLNQLLSRFTRSISQLLICHSGMVETKKFLDMPAKFPPPQDPKIFRLNSTKASIVFSDVNFRYEQELVLENVSFTIDPGSKVAIVGLSGVGKSTITRLLLGFYRPESGTIKIAGQNISEVKPESLCRVVGLVPQQPKFLAGSLADVIRYAKPSITDSEIVDILKKVKLDEFASIEAIKKPVGQGGVKLSGGQMQRVAIARALLREPYVLLLDEALSAQDVRTGMAVQKMINESTVDMTTLMITHQLLHTTDADKIIVLDQGKVVQQGTFTELKNEEEGVFRRLLDQYCRANGLDINMIGNESKPRNHNNLRIRMFSDGPEILSTATIPNDIQYGEGSFLLDNP